MTKIGNEAVILGGGLAGLVVARELLRRGWPAVRILEREVQVGGLARTIVRGGFRFDLGGHRFHSDSPALLTWLEELLGEDLLRVPRQSRIWLGDRFADYPLRFPGALHVFSPSQSFRILRSYLASTIRCHSPASDRSFEDWIVRRFGRALYEIYFRPYTEKVWGIPCHELSADWAAQRISLPSLSQAIRRAILPGRQPPATIVSRFWYPRCGFGSIPERLAQEVEGLGGQIALGATVTSVEANPDGFLVGYQQGGQIRLDRASHLISSIPLTALLPAISTEPDSEQILQSYPLRYRDHICVFLAVDSPRISPDSWTYFPQKELLFGRTHEPRNWSAALVPPERTSLVAEIFTNRDEPTWQQTDGDLIGRTVQELETIGFLPRHQVADGWVLRVEDAYPIYDLEYAHNVAQAKHFLSRWP
ncbi:MAG: FAD-dependent oxidoreductase, partial [Anaerolineae bacterium]